MSNNVYNIMDYYPDFKKITTHEVCFEIHGKPIYVRIRDPYGNLTDSKLKSKAWKYLKETSKVDVRRNI